LPSGFSWQIFAILGIFLRKPWKNVFSACVECAFSTKISSLVQNKKIDSHK
jgi:hypothetical protein